MDVKNRRKRSLDKPKIVRGVSFAGEEGYEALEVYDNAKHKLGKSGLIIDLLLLYKKSINVFGEDAISIMNAIISRMNITMSRFDAEELSIHKVKMEQMKKELKVELKDEIKEELKKGTLK